MKHREQFQMARYATLLMLLLIGFDFTVYAIWGRQAFGVSSLLTTILLVTMVRRRFDRAQSHENGTGRKSED
jgi:hypothetical protein